MTTTIDTRAAARSSAPSAPYRVNFIRVVRSEAIKLFSLRSTWWSLGVTVLLAVGISFLVAVLTNSVPEEFRGQVPVNPMSAVTAPLQFTMLVAGILGAMAITGEYSTGMIRSSLTAEPRRGAVLLAKALVVAVTLMAVTVVTSLLSILVVTPLYGGDGFAWDDAELTWIPLAFTIIAMATFALLGLGWGFLIRNGAGAIAATVGILFVLPIVMSLFAIGGESWQWLIDLYDYLPSSAAAGLTTDPSADTLRNVIVLLAWPVAALLGGWTVLRARDA
ncbi:ABC-2 type transport system permease protein [Microbacterium marinum]|uniref:ABC-2 type transport system permease protein n=1 Tax=Microbacterium marinum TaxID=421115 RepID=A0A7W7BR12_9MICO|nr:ABC transporter permease subunit [Microbacterium marinum]MBB4667244.1 ABC-2 type transport system permease protein [Microbacterium marinum]